MTHTFDAIVIGAGVVGSGAAYHLSKAGQRVLLLEQFEIDHQKGSSYGDSRIIRYAYDKVPYIKLIQDVFPLWETLQEESGESLLIKTGGIDFGYPDTETFVETLTSLQNMQIPHELLSAEDAQKRFPQFHFEPGMQVIYQADSGVLAASKCVLAHIQQAQKHGATIKDNSPVEKIITHSDSVEVTAAGETFSAGKLIIAAGSWTNDMLAHTGLHLPLHVQRCQLNFLLPEKTADYTTATFPIFIAHTGERHIYGMATHNTENPALKVAWHGGYPHNHPSEIDYAPEAKDTESLRPFLQTHIPGAATAPLQISRICLYTLTPDEDFVMDMHPEHKHIIFGAGFSGHGFKFGTLSGKILADLALTGTTEHDISLFPVARFQETTLAE